MNDKIVTIATFIFLLLIGSNAFLTMGSNLKDGEGNQINVLTGSLNSGFGTQITDKAQGVSIGKTTTANSSQPTTQGEVTITSAGNPIGLDAAQQFTMMAFGTQIVLFQVDGLLKAPGQTNSIFFPIIVGIIAFVSAIQFFVIAYFGSSLARAILGRIT